MHNGIGPPKMKDLFMGIGKNLSIDLGVLPQAVRAAADVSQV